MLPGRGKAANSGEPALLRPPRAPNPRWPGAGGGREETRKAFHFSFPGAGEVSTQGKGAGNAGMESSFLGIS